MIFLEGLLIGEDFAKRESGLMGCIFIQQSADHFLVRRIIFFCLFFKKLHTGSAKGYSYLNGFFLQCQFLR